MSEEMMMEAVTRRSGRSRLDNVRRTLCSAFAFVLVLGAGSLWAAPAQAVDHVLEYEMTASTTQAGGHPDITTFMHVENADTGSDFPSPNCGCQDPKIISFDAPAGVIADPHATPQCSQVEFADSECPIDSQVGVVLIGFDTQTLSDPELSYPLAMYNLVTHPNQAGLLGFYAPIIDSPVYSATSARTESDYGLNLRTEGITHLIGLGISVLKITLWGVPADPSNDPHRYGPTPCDSQGTAGGAVQCVPGYSSNAPLRPFLDNPTTCGEPLSASVEVTSYDLGVSSMTAPFAPTTGCDQLSFNPSLFGQPTTTAADTPSGLEVDLNVPQDATPSVPSPSEIRATTVTLPEGFAINPSAAGGKASCSDAQARIGSRSEGAECPEFSRVGTLTISSSSLPGPLPGYIYLGEPRPGDPYRLILAADGFGVHVKLPGSIHADSQTGRLTASFENLPQFPFSEFNMHFFGSEQGLLVTPTHCGTYSVDSTFTPWDSALPDQSSKQFFNLESGPGGTACPGAARPFNPSFQAGVSNRTGGSHAPFTLQLTRPDGDQNLSGLTVHTPPGFSASLRGVSYCSDAALAAAAQRGTSGLQEEASPSCPATSQIGETVAGAGAGDRPIYLPGKAYLAGPYEGAPLSLAVITPAVSGPYDLGNVVVRAAIQVNPETAEITAVSDPLPQIIEGVPLRLRSIRINLNRPDFTLNPTDCDPLSVQGEVLGTEGGLARVPSHFQVADCTNLDFAPKLSLKLTGSAKQAGNPAITATLTAKPGEANISRVQVTLPPTELVDNAHISNPCTRVQFNEGKGNGEKCPPSSILGFAKAETPLLEKPLEGPIYFRATGRAGLPDVVAALNGQINIVLDGHVDSIHGRLRTTFETVPDAPISKAVLKFDGGNKGIIENSPRLCAHPQRLTAAITGQNGKTADQNPVVGTPCGKKHKHKRGTRAHHDRRAHR